MYFQLRRDCRNWFSDIRDVFDVDFDIYYLCFVLGILGNRKNPNIGENTTDLVDYFPEVHRASSRIQIGIMLHNAISSLGLAFTKENRNNISKRIMDYIDANSPSKMTDSGVKEMNAYASGGFEELIERFPDKPRTIEHFLVKYLEIIDDIESKAERQ